MTAPPSGVAAGMEMAAKICEEKGRSFTTHNFTISDTGKAAANVCAAAIRAAVPQIDKQGNDAEIAAAVREAAKLENVSAEMLVSVIRGEYRSALPQAGEFVVVPRKPTDAMLDAGNEILKDRITIYRVWNAMLAAATKGGE